MNKIIKCKRYDTDTATAVAETSHSNVSQFDWWQETLYRKRTGEFFLHGEGHANSKYCEQIEKNAWGAGEKIIPMTLKQAQEWAEKYLDADEYETIFGSVDEGEKRQISLVLSADIIEMLKRNSVAANMTASDYVTELIKREDRSK